MTSSTFISSYYIEIFILRFCIIDIGYIKPFPRDIVDLMWLFMSGWKQNGALTHHFMICALLDSSAREIYGYPLRYLMTLPILL